MTFRIPPLTGEPCHCEACVVAGVSSRPCVRTPDGELHGRKLADWYRARDEAVAALRAFRSRTMPKAEPQTTPEGEGLV